MASSFCKKVDDCTDSGKVDIDKLKSKLETAAWKAGFNSGDMTEVFAKINRRQEDAPLAFKCLGMLWCNGDLNDKANVFVSMVNPPGQSSGKISASDKELKQISMLTAELASVFTVQCFIRFKVQVCT